VRGQEGERRVGALELDGQLPPLALVEEILPADQLPENPHREGREQLDKEGHPPVSRFLDWS
jgi:hypothetical protein